MKVSEDLADFLFRVLFSLIFVGLGAEHMVSDDLIQRLMPAWVPFPRLVSFSCGMWLLVWGVMIVLGWKLRLAAQALGVFVIIVTIAVHLPGVLLQPLSMHPECGWIWDILQRTNLVKNLCLLGVCFHLLHHNAGRYSLERYLKSKQGIQ